MTTRLHLFDVEHSGQLLVSVNQTTKESKILPSC
jgi:hypothetical protein